MSLAVVPASQVAAPQAGVSLDVFALVPRDDRALYATLPAAAKDELRSWVKWLSPLISAGKKPKGLMAALEQIGRMSGTSTPTARRKWDAYWTEGWKGLVNRSLAGPEWQERSNTEAGIARRPEFLQFVRLTFEQNQRGSRSAWKFVLKKRWQQWRATGDTRFAIPGYDTPPPAAEGFDHPAGWSYENLMKQASSRFELKASRIGRAAAYDERPLNYTSRVGLWVGSHYMLDDMWHDFFVNSLSEGQAGRPLELFSHDLYSARKVRWGVRVRVKGDDGKYKGLEERMTRLILAATLFLDGYSPRGTVIVAEHGTAAISAAVEAALCECSGGLITVSRSGMQGAVAHGGQYPGIARGNPRHKASLESSNNLVHNAFAHLPGQTGKDVLSRPEGLGALLTENATLLRAYAKLSPGRAALLEFPLLDVRQWHGLAHDIYGQIETDPEHNLTDWAQCNHLVQQVWVEGGWRDLPDFRTLDDLTRERLTAALGAGTVPTHSRHMTRREVWDQGAGELIKLPGHGVWDILQADLGAERTVTANELAFKDAEIDSGTLRFSTRGVNAFGHPVDLADRTAYRVVVNPFAPDTAFVGDRAGRYVGEFCAIVRPTRAGEGDPSMQQAFGAVAKREAELLTPLRERHAGEAAAKEARTRRNVRLTDETKPATKEERAEIKRQRATAFPSQDFSAPEVLEPANPAPRQETPAVGSGEGFWPAAEQPETNRPTHTFSYDGSDFI